MTDELDEERREKFLARLAGYRVIDDVFMRAVFRDNLLLAQDSLRTITGMTGLEIVSEETQRDLKMATGARSAALDVFCVGTDGTQYDMEVQVGNELDPLRFRYYGSLMDVDFLNKGKPYAELPERWVVVVLEEDPDGKDRARRVYRNVEVTEGFDLGDGTCLLYANASYRGDDDLGRLMADFCEPYPDKIHNEMLRKRVQYLKRDPEGVREMGNVSTEIFNEGLELGVKQGMQQGMQQTLIDNVRSLMKTAGWDARKALSMLGIPADDQPRYLAML